MKEAQEETATKVANRVRRDKPYAYKKKAHEEQATFNEKVQEAVWEAHESLETATASPGVERAKTALQQGLAAEIADHSVNGWGVVAEYTADELADDSDDEKWLEKAEKAAERKAGLPFVQKPASITNCTLRFALFQPYGNFAAPYPAVQTLQQSGGSGCRLGLAVRPATQQAVGPCFACGELGHLQSYCPRTVPGQEVVSFSWDNA